MKSDSIVFLFHKEFLIDLFFSKHINKELLVIFGKIFYECFREFQKS